MSECYGALQKTDILLHLGSFKLLKVWPKSGRTICATIGFNGLNSCNNVWKSVTVALDRVVFPPLRRWNGESVPVCLGGSHFSASTGRSMQLVGHWILQKQCIFSSSLWNTGSAPHPFEDIWACVGVWPTSLHVVCGLWSWSSVDKCLLWVGNKLLHQVSWGFVHEWGKSGAGDLQMDWCSFSSDVDTAPVCTDSYRLLWPR